MKPTHECVIVLNGGFIHIPLVESQIGECESMVQDAFEKAYADPPRYLFCSMNDSHFFSKGMLGWYTRMYPVYREDVAEVQKRLLEKLEDKMDEGDEWKGGGDE